MSDVPSWSTQKVRLTKNGQLHPIFAKLDTITFKATAPTNFEPRLIAVHAQRLSELLDRCLSIRKDIRDLEILAYRAEVDYNLFKVTSDLDEKMDYLRLQVDPKTAERTGFQDAVSAFSDKATLEKGLSAAASGRAGSLDRDLADTNELKQLIADRWKAVRGYQEDYHARHTDDGNAHNFGQRACRLAKVFAVLIDEAFARAAALAKGIKIIYGFDVPDLPTNTMLKDLDSFAMWSFRTIRSLARAAEQETDTEVIIPLVQPWFNGPPLVDPAAFNQEIAKAGGGEVATLPPFDIPDTGLFAPNARLKGIGLSFGAKFNPTAESGIDHDQTSDSFKRLMVTLTPPPQPGEETRPAPIVLGNVGLLDASQLAAVQGSSVQNLSPFGRSWTVTIHPFVVWKDNTMRDLTDRTGSRSPILDLKLTLRFYVPGKFEMIPQDSDNLPV
ncbi:hypothetical protein [Bradyrhizobium sp. 169]|uniref:hypothetical protein n=1 Tax=Bradyrhizobium sp. 169 TaxID=2782640 RepID=UPI001FF7E05C|nr:hypothetical protein [Bradyrhizobium sp. 169]MCK1586918.1 hypothetical protein [Bradyrhizobium sp. 169]